MATDPASLISVGSLRSVYGSTHETRSFHAPAAHNLSSAIFDETKTAESEPVVQCVQVKPLAPQPNGQDRYRAVFSDITNYVQTMIATRE